MRRLRILTWHTHGAYLYYLTQAPHEFYVLSKPGRPPGYGGRCGGRPWGPNVHDLPVEDARNVELDCIVFQDDVHWLDDQHRWLTGAQRRLPRIYVEHDPPRENPTDTRHPVDDPEVLLVHVTPFNALMWDSGRTPTRVIEHGVIAPRQALYTGELARGIVIVNNLARRGRRLGADIYKAARAQVPLDLVGMGAEELDGVGEIPHGDLPAFAARYRFLFNPIRWTSMGLAVIEAMMAGVPVIGLATTEMARAIENGVSGWVDTSPARLVERMRALLADRNLSRALGAGARRRAMQRFGIERFVHDWNAALAQVTGTRAEGGVVAHAA